MVLTFYQAYAIVQDKVIQKQKNNIMSEQFPTTATANSNNESNDGLIRGLPEWSDSRVMTPPSFDLVSPGETSPQKAYFVDTAEFIVNEAKKGIDYLDDGRDVHTDIDAFFTSIDNHAKRGMIVDSRGDTFSADDIQAGLDQYYAWASLPDEQRSASDKPLNYFTSRGGLRSSLTQILESEPTRQAALDVIRARQLEREQEKLTKEKAIHGLGRRAVTVINPY
jgi:hypothetical protein